MSKSHLMRTFTPVRDNTHAMDLIIVVISCHLTKVRHETAPFTPITHTAENMAGRMQTSKYVRINLRFSCDSANHIKTDNTTHRAHTMLARYFYAGSLALLKMPMSFPKCDIW